MTDDRRFEELEADARHASERYRLYRAKVHGPRPTSTGRLQELQREAEPFEALAFSPAGLSVYQLGNNGTAAKPLKRWTV